MTTSPSTGSRKGAIVLTEHIRGLGVVRSLGRRGIPVWVLRPKGDLLSSVSRYCRKSLTWPDADDRHQLEYLLALADQHGLDGWSLFATADETSAFCARNAAELSNRFSLTIPPWDLLRWAYDKRLTHLLAADAGVDQPRTIWPIDAGNLSGLDLSFPVVLKPAFKKTVNRFTHDKAWRVDDRQTLVARYAEASALVDPDVVMLQELIPGGGDTQFSYAALCDDGRVVASVTARRTRQYPVDFGHSSSFVETIDEWAVEEPARRILAAMRYTGLAEVEFKYDKRDGHYKLLEVNPRAWTWHALCRRAGVDFPYLLWSAAHGEPVPELRGTPGVKWMRVSTDLPAAFGEMRRGRLTLAGYLRSLRGPVEFATFAADDPFPSLMDLFVSAWARVKLSLAALRLSPNKVSSNSSLPPIGPAANVPKAG